MSLPKLQRIKVSSERELRTWLRKNAGQRRDVIIVTCNKTSRTKHLGSDQLRHVAREHGWEAGRSYTLDGNLVGHLVRHR